MRDLFQICMIVISSHISAQDYLTISVHSLHSKTLESVFLKTEQGQGLEMSYSNTAKSSLKFISLYSLSYDFGELKSGTDYNSLAASYSLLKTLLKNKSNTCFINAGAGAYLSFEQSSSYRLNKAFDKFSPGAIGRIELEYYIRKLALTVNGQQLYRPWSDLGDLQWRVGFGLKCIIN